MARGREELSSARAAATVGSGALAELAREHAEAPLEVEGLARSQWQLFRRRFLRHKLAVVALFVLVLLYLMSFVFAHQISRHPLNPPLTGKVLLEAAGCSSKRAIEGAVAGHDGTDALELGPVPGHHAVVDTRGADLARAREAVARLAALHQAAVDAKIPYWPEQIEIQRRATAGWLARAEGRNEDAQRLLGEAVELEATWPS